MCVKNILIVTAIKIRRKTCSYNLTAATKLGGCTTFIEIKNCVSKRIQCLRFFTHLRHHMQTVLLKSQHKGNEDVQIIPKYNKCSIQGCIPQELFYKTG